MDRNKLRLEILHEIAKGDTTREYTPERFGVSEDVFQAEINFLEKTKLVDAFSYYDGKNHLLECAVLREKGELYLLKNGGSDLIIEKMKLRFSLLNEIAKGNYDNLQDNFNLSGDSFDSAIRFLDLEGYLVSKSIIYGDGRPHLYSFTKLTAKGNLINSQYKK